MNAAGPDGERTAALLPFPCTGDTLTYLAESCTMAALFQAIDNIMQHPCLTLFHTFSCCLTLLIRLPLLRAFLILFPLLRFTTPDKVTHTHTEQQLLCREEDALLVKLLSVALLNGSMNLVKSHPGHRKMNPSSGSGSTSHKSFTDVFGTASRKPGNSIWGTASLDLPSGCGSSKMWLE